jgi:branched-chain amino acid transport system substrate-binding protein
MVTDANFAAPPSGLATSAALDPSQLPPAGQDFAARFEAEYGRSPGRYAAYGYEAMAVILDSVERASDPLDRSSVVEAFFATADRDSVLGTYSIDEEGNTTLDRMTGYELRGPAPPEPAAELTAR